LRLAVDDVPGRKWQPHTPMMAAGLTEHAWSVKELLTTIPLVHLGVNGKQDVVNG